jgi:hypothetical protein
VVEDCVNHGIQVRSVEGALSFDPPPLTLM